MAGAHQAISEFKRNRIGELTKEGLSTTIIGERVGLSRGSVYRIQVKLGFRVVVSKKK